jgi:hypothetical protein
MGGELASTMAKFLTLGLYNPTTSSQNASNPQSYSEGKNGYSQSAESAAA